MHNYVPLNVRITKRILDIILAVTVFIVTLPLCIITMILIKVTSKGPIFYKQQRIGELNNNGAKIFNIVKFRTMYIDAESDGPKLASKNDNRITSFGLFMRRTRIDEIPQIINIFKGDMSFIGPRPERPYFNGINDSYMPFFTDRTYGLKPGLTGMAQIYQGYDQNLEDVKLKATWDYSYALHLTKFSSWLKIDVIILYKTMLQVLMLKGQ